MARQRTRRRRGNGRASALFNPEQTAPRAPPPHIDASNLEETLGGISPLQTGSMRGGGGGYHGRGVAEPGRHWWQHWQYLIVAAGATASLFLSIGPGRAVGEQIGSGIYNASQNVSRTVNGWFGNNSNGGSIAVQTPVVASPTATAITQTPTTVPTELSTLEQKAEIELSALRNANPKLASMVASIFGSDGYDNNELNVLIGFQIVSSSASRGSIPDVSEDLKAILVSESYRISKMQVNGRAMDLIVLTSNPDKAPLYAELMPSVMSKVEAFTGLQYSQDRLIVYTPPENLGASLTIRPLIITWYPEELTKRNVTSLEEDIAHESDHLLTRVLNLPIWLSEGKANMTGYAVINNGEIPAWDDAISPYKDGETVSEFYARRANLVRDDAGRLVIPTQLRDAGYNDPNAYSQVGELTVLGEVLFFDLFHLGGPDYLSAVIRGVNSLSQKQFVTTETFKDIALQNSPERLRSEVNTVLNSYFPLETNVLK